MEIENNNLTRRQRMNRDLVRIIIEQDEIHGIEITNNVLSTLEILIESASFSVEIMNSDNDKDNPPPPNGGHVARAA